jgi:cytochrome o ubiquinol oxidase operon protein cyoD
VGPGVPAGLAVLAIAQMGVHLVFFLHISTGPDNTNNVLALAFGVSDRDAHRRGSLWIMANLNGNMIPASAVMEMSAVGRRQWLSKRRDRVPAVAGRGIG